MGREIPIDLLDSGTLRVWWCTGTVRTAFPFFNLSTKSSFHTLWLSHRLRENEIDVQIFTFFHSYSYMSFTNAEQTVKSTFWEFTGSIYLHSHAPKKQACFPDHKVFSLKKITDQILSLTTSFFFKLFYFYSVRNVNFY